MVADCRNIKDLAEAQLKALDDARKTGADRQKADGVRAQQLTEEIQTTWKTENEADESKYDFLKTKEDDDEWNGRLSQAKAFVDKTFTTDARDPKLTPEQRRDAVRNHVSLRGRAIGFSMLKLENNRLKAELEAKQKVIDEFKGQEPSPGEGHPAEKKAAAVSPADSWREELRRRAVPGKPGTSLP